VRHGIAIGLVCVLSTVIEVITPTRAASITVSDDHQRTVTLQSPARRAITTAPHATEMVYAAGAGEYLVGTTRGSNYPPSALDLPSVGDGLRPNLEIATILQPDLLIAWQPYASDRLSQLMQRQQVPVFYSDPRTLTGIADTIQTLGHVFGTQTKADATAEALRQRIAQLENDYATRRPLRVFIQVGENPLYTLNGKTLLSEAIKVCGGINIFSDLAPLAPQVSLESVIAASPDAVIVGVTAADPPHQTLQNWQNHGLRAATLGHVLSFDADLLYRPGPRFIDATEQLCQALEQVRQGQ